jgi:hypothetical protein
MKGENNMATGAYAKELEQMLVDEFEANSNMDIRTWVSLVLEILSKMLKNYWVG